jgi:hypothetical protein
MAFNAGAFAGALGQSALSTYERLNEQQLNAIKKAQLVKEIQEKEALDTAFRESQARVGQTDDYSQAIRTGGGVGTQQAKMLSDQGALTGATPEDVAFERASAESAAGALRENAVRQGAVPADKAALPTMTPTEFTKTQAMDDYVKRAGQVSRKGALEAIQLKQVVRESELQDQFDKAKSNLDDTLARIEGTAETGGLKGLAAAAEKEGLKVKFVEGKNGVGSRIQVLGPKGDVLETISDIGTATQKLSEAAMQQFMTKSVSLLGSPDKVIAAIQQDRQLKLKGREVDIKAEEVRDRKPYLSAIAGKANAETKILGEGADAKKAGAVFLEQYAALPIEKQNGPEGRALLQKAELATATKSGDVSRVAANTPMGRAEAMYATVAKEAAKVGEAPPDRVKFFASQGFAPQQVIEGETAKVEALIASGRMKEAEAKVKQFNQTFANTPIQMPANRTAKTALPVPK